MLPVVASSLLCEVPKFVTATMPRVVPDQREKFENDELFRKLAREGEVKYTGHRDRPAEERIRSMENDCRVGIIELAFVGSGTNLQLACSANPWSDGDEDSSPSADTVNFDREVGKVHLKSEFILNGVCVRWRGWLDLQKLEGVGTLEFNEERAEVEDAQLRSQIEAYNRRLREFEDRQRAYQLERDRQAEAEAEVVQALLEFSEKDASNSSS